MKFCKYCGVQLEDSAKFCYACGKSASDGNIPPIVTPHNNNVATDDTYSATFQNEQEAVDRHESEENVKTAESNDTENNLSSAVSTTISNDTKHTTKDTNIQEQQTTDNAQPNNKFIQNNQTTYNNQSAQYNGNGTSQELFQNGQYQNYQQSQYNYQENGTQYQNRQPFQNQQQFQNHQQFQGNYQNPNNVPYGNMYQKPSYDMDNEPLSVGQWLLTIFIMCVPFANIVMMFVWAFGSGNTSRKNFMRASLIFALILLILYILLIIFLAILGYSSYNHYSRYYYY